MEKLTSEELYERIKTDNTTKFMAQYMPGLGLNVNMVDAFNRLIKDAARCNAYNSDVYYDIKSINEMLENFKPEEIPEPIWIGFRRMGVDGTSYVLCNADKQMPYLTLSRNYFALYCITVVPTEYGNYNIIFSEYGM